MGDPHAHGRADGQGGDVAEGEPPGVAGLGLVTAWAAAQRAGMEAHRERLAHQPGPRVGDDVAGVGVDADQAGDLHGDARFLGGLPDRRIGRALPGIDVPARQSQSPVSQRRTSSSLPVTSRTAAKAHGATQVAAGASG